jgi:lipopolysaccharide biosynthesis glycosyltransferase
MVFSKYEAFKLLDKYESVMWLDYDICLLNNLNHLWLSPSEELTILVAENKVVDSFYRELPGYNMEKKCVATGLFLVKRGIGDYSAMYDWCLQMTKKHIDDLYLPEQGIFNLLIEIFRIPVNALDMSIYAVHPKEDNKSSLIIHSWGGVKFWNGHYDFNWQKNYISWKSMGGESYAPSDNPTPRFLRYTYSLFDRIIG